MGERPVGRPSKRTPENAAKLCSMIAGGSLVIDALKEIGASYENLHDWEEQDPEFSQSIARARKQWAQVAAEEGMKIADEPPRMIVTEDGERVDPGWVAHTTSRLNYKKWLISKRDPDNFGDGRDASTTVNVGVSVAVMSEDRRAELIRKKQECIAERKSALVAPSLLNGENGNGRH